MEMTKGARHAPLTEFLKMDFGLMLWFCGEGLVALTILEGWGCDVDFFFRWTESFHPNLLILRSLIK
jgi:hypothetical protein